MKSKYVKITSIVLLIMLLFTAVVSFAWFYSNREVTIGNGSTMAVTVGSKLEMALVGDGIAEDVWSQKIEANINKTNIMDCTGDGTNFYYPLALDGNDEVLENAYFPVFNDEDNGLAEETYLIQFQLKLRTTSKIDVFLAGNGGVADTGSAVYPHPAQNPSLFGSFSSNYIAGCARVAIYEITTDDGGTATENLRYVWVPNSHYQIYEENRQYYFRTDGTIEKYTYVSYDAETATYTEQEYTVEDYLNGKLFVADDHQLAQTNTSRAGLGLPVVRFEQEGIEQVKQIAIRIWFEGSDREAHSAFNRGVVNYRLHFAGFMRKDDATAEDVAKLKTIVWDSADRKLYYAGYDKNDPNKQPVGPDNVIISSNGIDWREWNPNESDPKLLISAAENPYNLYVRLKETISTYASQEYHTIEIARQ